MTLGAYINICKSYNVELTVYNDPISRTNSFQLLKRGNLGRYFTKIYENFDKYWLDLTAFEAVVQDFVKIADESLN